MFYPKVFRHPEFTELGLSSYDLTFQRYNPYMRVQICVSQYWKLLDTQDQVQCDWQTRKYEGKSWFVVFNTFILEGMVSV